MIATAEATYELTKIANDVTAEPCRLREIGRTFTSIARAEHKAEIRAIEKEELKKPLKVRSMKRVPKATTGSNEELENLILRLVAMGRTY